MSKITRRAIVAIAAAGASSVMGGGLKSAASATPKFHVLKNPACGCCDAWVEHLRRAGITAIVEENEHMASIKDRAGVPEDLWSCHTGMIDGYVVEGHVPAREILRLVEERPAAVGLAVPGMPVGSPGMEQGGLVEPFDVILFTGANRSVFASY